MLEAVLEASPAAGCIVPAMRSALAILCAIVGASTLFTVPWIGIPAFVVALLAARNIGVNDESRLFGWLFLLAVAGIALGMMFGGLPALDP